MNYNLKLVEINVEENIGIYIEEDVWVSYRLEEQNENI